MLYLQLKPRSPFLYSILMKLLMTFSLSRMTNLTKTYRKICKGIRNTMLNNTTTRVKRKEQTHQWGRGGADGSTSTQEKRATRGSRMSKEKNNTLFKPTSWYYAGDPLFLHALERHCLCCPGLCCAAEHRQISCHMISVNQCFVNVVKAE